MKKIYILLILLMMILSGVSYSDYNDSIKKRARERGISYEEARKSLDKDIDTVLNNYIKETYEEQTAIKGPNPSVYVPYDIIAYINKAQDSYIEPENNQKIYIFQGDETTFFRNMGKELFGTSFYDIGEYLFSKKEKDMYMAGYNKNEIGLGYVAYDEKGNLLVGFSFIFKYKKAKDGGYYVMCNEVDTWYADGSTFKNKEAMKPFRYRGN